MLFAIPMNLCDSTLYNIKVFYAFNYFVYNISSLITSIAFSVVVGGCILFVINVSLLFWNFQLHVIKGD